MTMTANRIIKLVLIGLVMACPALAEPVVKALKIRTVGPVPADEQMIRSYIAVREGAPLNRAEVANDVRSLLASGKLADVTAEVDAKGDGVSLVYVVRMKYKLVNPVRVKGNKELSVAKVRDIVGLNPGDFIDDPTIAARLVILTEEYRKRLFATAKMEAGMDPVAGQPGQVSLLINIREGDKAQIVRYEFPGRKSVDMSVIREAMEIMAWYNPLSWFHKTPYNVEELSSGCERIRAVYKDAGFLDVEIKPPVKREEAPGRYIISVPIQENLKYSISKVSVSGATIYPEAPLLKAADLKIAGEASTSIINKAADAIRDYYESRGYMDTYVQPKLDLREKAGEVDVRFVVNEGRLTTVRNVLVRGNSVTKDKVIRRELLIYPGDQFDGVRVRTTENRLRNLGFFSNVNCEHEPVGTTNKTDLVFNVEEQRTGQFMTGVGFSSIDKLIGFAEVSQGNFDISGKPFVGAGQKIKLRGEFGSTREAYTLSFVEPWFMDRKLSLSVDLYSVKQDDRDYEVLRQGGAVGLGVPLWGPNRLDFKYRLEQVSTKDSADTNAYVVVDSDGDTNVVYFSDPRSAARGLGIPVITSLCRPGVQNCIHRERLWAGRWGLIRIFMIWRRGGNYIYPCGGSMC